MTVADHADLDLETDFMLTANVVVAATPDTESAIMSKQGAYELFVTGTPSLSFGWRLYSTGGTPSTCTISATLNQETALTAYYNGAYGVLSADGGQASFAMSGSVAATSTDVHIGEFDGRIDDVAIRLN